jgi:TPR repeat protein
MAVDEKAEALFQEATRIEPAFRDPEPATVMERKRRALELFERAAKLGHVAAMHRAGTIRQYLPDPKGSFDWYVRLAQMGDAEPLQTNRASSHRSWPGSSRRLQRGAKLGPR